MILLFVGPKGSGKDTQTQLLESSGFANISTGSLFRQEMQDNTELGMKSKQYYDAGKLVPDELVLEILKKHISKAEADDIVLNGVVRTLEQIKPTEEMLASIEKKIDKVIYFNLSDEEAVKRLANRWTCPVCNTVYHSLFDPPKVAGVCDKDGATLLQRADDKPDAVKMRLSEDRTKTGPVVDHYREIGILHEIDGSKSIDEVASELHEIIKVFKEQQ